MEGKPFHTTGVINLAPGETIKDLQMQGLPAKGLYVIEFVGINGFAQPQQILFTALQVQTNSMVGIYPFALAGSSSFGDPQYPARSFGSQQVLLYADPNSPLTFTVSRSASSGEARVLIDVSGRMIPAPKKLPPLASLARRKKSVRRR